MIFLFLYMPSRFQSSSKCVNTKFTLSRWLVLELQKIIQFFFIGRRGVKKSWIGNSFFMPIHVFKNERVLIEITDNAGFLTHQMIPTRSNMAEIIQGQPNMWIFLVHKFYVVFDINV